MKSANLHSPQISPSSRTIPSGTTEGWERSTNINYLRTQALRHKDVGFGHPDVEQQLHLRNTRTGLLGAAFSKIIIVLHFFVGSCFEFSVNQLLHAWNWQKFQGGGSQTSLPLRDAVAPSQGFIGQESGMFGYFEYLGLAPAMVC